MMRINIYILFIFFSFPLITKGQVSVDKPLVFINDSSSIKNVEVPQDSSNLIRFYDINGEKFISRRITSNTVDLSILNYNQPSNGMVFNLISDFNITDTLNLLFNSSLYYLYSDNKIVSDNSPLESKVSKIYFQDTAFFVLQVSPRSCPVGFIKANDQYCIEKNENAADFYLNAINDCAQKNATLCSYGQWYYACQKFKSTYPDFNDNWEFIDDASDHSQTVDLVAGSDCKNNTTENIDANQRNYRCCYDF